MLTLTFSALGFGFTYALWVAANAVAKHLAIAHVAKRLKCQHDRHRAWLAKNPGSKMTLDYFLYCEREALLHRHETCNRKAK